MRAINKAQLEAPRDRKASLLSFDLVTDDANTYILFNDDKRNTKIRQQNKRPKAYYGRVTGKSALMVVKINHQGEITGEKILKSSKNIQVAPEFFHKLDDKHYIIQGRGKGGAKLGLLKIP